MSVKRRDLIRYFEENGFYLLREGSNHSIFTNGEKTIPIKRPGINFINPIYNFFVGLCGFVVNYIPVPIENWNDFARVPVLLTGNDGA